MTEEEKRVLKEAKHTRRQERNRRLSQIPFIRKYVRILLPLDLTVTAIFAWLDGTGYFQGHPKARMIGVPVDGTEPATTFKRTEGVTQTPGKNAALQNRLDDCLGLSGAFSDCQRNPTTFFIIFSDCFSKEGMI